MTGLINVVLPAAIVVFAGWIVGRRIEIDLPTLTKLTLYLFAPALTLDAMYRSELPLRDGTRIFAAFALASAVLYVLVAIISRAFAVEKPVQKSLVATTLFANTGNFGLSLTFLALGQEGLDRAVVAYVASALLVFGLGPGLVSGGGFRKGLETTFRLPLIWALMLGLGLRAFDVALPIGVADGLHLLSQATVPLLLVTLGLQISRTRFVPHADDFFAASLRLAGGPIVAYVAARALGLDTLGLQVLVLQCATPTAVNALLVTSQFGGDAPRAARAVVLTSVLAFATIPIVMALLGVHPP